MFLVFLRDIRPETDNKTSVSKDIVSLGRRET